MKWYTLKDTAEMLSIDRTTLYKWEKKGLIKITRINNIPRIAESEIKRITGTDNK